MSFYGNIANGGKTNLTFDKVYPNRTQMDLRAGTDGVFVGRFVLVEYDDNTFSYRTGFMKEDTIPVDTTETYTIYADSNCIYPYTVDENNPGEGYAIYHGDVVTVGYPNQRAFFACTSHAEDGTANFELMQLGADYANSNDYSLNYNVDKETYSDQFIDGWDSTIWQKVVENGEFKYIMVGELNSKVPRFYVKSEAPTAEPVPPHFDANSTNMDYTLHVQPNWGFRIKKATATKGEGDLISDTEVKVPYLEYNKEDDSTITEQSYNGAIYFNKDGFDKINRNPDNDTKDEILFEPTGISGNKYYQHNPAEIQSVKEDIQELTIHLPTIGNAVSELWDLMYGDKKEDKTFKPIRNDDIAWEAVPEPKRAGVRMVNEDPNSGGFSFDDHQVETVAGCINSVHDLMGMIVLEGNTSLADAKTDRIYYGKLTGSSRDGYFMKTRKNTYTPLAPEDLEGYVNSKKYMELTQYTKGEYHTKTNDNFYEELDEKPTPNTNYYDIEATPIDLKVWVPEVTPDDPEDEDVTYNHYWMDNESNYLKDIALKADPEKTYYTLELIQQTYTSDSINTENGVYLKEIYKPVPRTEIVEEDKTYYNGYLYFEILGHEVDEEGNLTDIPIYGDKVYELMPQIYDVDGNPVLDENGKPTFEEAGPLNKDAIYFKTNYQIIPGTDNGELVHPLCNMDGDPFNASNMPEDATKVIFIDFDEKDVEGKAINYYFTDTFEIEENEETISTTGYRKLQLVDDYDPTVIYYTVIATQETGKFEEEIPEGEEPPEEPEVTIVHYYVPEKYYYKQGNNDYIFGKEPEMVQGVEYFILSGHEAPLDVTFYEPTKYYYEKEVTTTVDGKDVVEIVQILDNDTTMKTHETNLGDNEKIIANADNLVYFLTQEAYVVNDSSGILSAGSIWNSTVDSDKIPKTLELGKLYQGEDVDEDGNEVEPGVITSEEKAKRMYEWKELDGFARTLNTIHGLILKLNQYFKFNDSLTRDRTTVQGCLNCINDIINDFAVLNPGEIAVIDEYGRIKSATLFTTATDESNEEGWISVVVDPNAIETKITIRHNDAKTPEEILGQTNDQNLIFGDTFKALSFGIDEKGHIDEAHFKEFTMRMPNLKVTDDDTKQIVTDFEVGESGQALVISRENVGNFTLVGYTGTGSTTDVGADDTVNQAFGKLQTKLNKEIDDRIKAINDLDMAEDASTTQFISSISQTDGKLNVTRAAAGTLNLGSGYAIAEAAADIDGNDSINSAFGKVEAKFKVLNGDSSEPGSIAYTIAEMAINADDNTSIDKLNEIAAWIVNDQTGVAKMNADIAKNASDIAALQIASGETGTNVSGLTTRIDDLEAIVTEDAVNTWVNVQSDWTEASETSPAFIKNKPDLENLVKTTTEFSYTYNETTTQLTIDGLMAYIAGLEKRIYDLEHPTESDPGTTE